MRFAVEYATKKTISEAQANLADLVDNVAEIRQPILITGERANAVLVSEADWQGMIETLYLLGIPGMRESLFEAMATPLEEFSNSVEW